MAYAFMRTMVQTRSKGHTATGAVCYREGLAASSTIPGADGQARLFDYTRRTGIEATGWAAPPGTDASWGDPVTWAHRIEAVDKRKNSRQCRDDVVGIPVELVEAGVAEEVVQAYADRLAAEHKTVVRYALHKPARGGKNHHAHVLYPGRHVEGLTFSRKRDREQDNPGKGGGPDLVTRHKAIWSELCRARGLELDWTSEAPGHHLGPALCAVKRARLVEETRETIRETVAASTPEKEVPGERTLQAVAEIATRVNDGLTVREMLEIERRRKREEELRGRRAPRPVPAPSPFQPEVLPAAAAPEVLPPVKRAPEVPPPARTAPEVLPPRRETPQVLPPVRRPEVLPPVRRQAAVFPPREVATGIVAAEIKEELPRETAATLSGVERYIAQQRQTLAHGLALAAMRKLSEDAKKRERERARAASVQPAPASRIRRIADWVLDCARRVLERLGLKPAAAPEHEVSRTPRRPDASTSPPPPRPTPTLWGRYQVRWPQHAADREIVEDLRGKPLPEALGSPVYGIETWRRVLKGMFEGDKFHAGVAVPKPKSLPRSLAPSGQASPDAATHAADYADSLPTRYRARFDEERIAERSLEVAARVRQSWRYRSRFTSEKRKQTLQDDAVRKACGDDAQRLDREMHAERHQWERHWNVLVRHDTLLREEEGEQLRREYQRRQQERRPEPQEPARQPSPVRQRERPGPELTR